MNAGPPVADTGFVVAIANRRDSHHTECVRVYEQFTRILLPQTVLVESAFLIRRDAGAPVVVQFLRSLEKSRFELIALSTDDLAFSANILDKYADSRIDFVDASVLALAEGLSCSTILTLDRRDFVLYRPTSRESFTLLP